MSTVLTASKGKWLFLFYTEVMLLAENEKVLILFILLGVSLKAHAEPMQKKHSLKWSGKEYLIFNL